jgi:glycosyltransferase involved in cell wall biosynthesis
MMISVVVCTYNRSQTLARMLASYFEQEGIGDAEHELIVVDNNSSDETRGTALKYASRRGFNYMREPEQGLSAARNRGIKQARGAVIAFLDDDVLVDRRWLQTLRQCYRDTSAAVVGGKAVLLLEADPPPWFGPFFREWLSEVDLGTVRREVPDGLGLYGVNLSFDAAALKAAGGFETHLGRRGTQLMGGEETTLVGRLAAESARIIYEPGAAVKHIVGKERLTWNYFVSLARGYASTKQAREPDRGPLWQILRVARSLLSVLRWQCQFAAAYALRSDSYTLSCMQWETRGEIAYMALRLQRLWTQLTPVFQRRPKDLNLQKPNDQPGTVA